MNSKQLTKASAIAAIYVILVALELPFGTLTFGPVQIRVAEALVLLPLIERAAIPGVFIGCLLANTLLTFTSGFGIIDIVGGSLVTLVAAYLTSLVPRLTGRKPLSYINVLLGTIPPVVLNGLIVSLWVAYFFNFNYWATVGLIALGELGAIGLVGSIVLYAYSRIQQKI